MKEIGLYEAKSKFSALLAEVDASGQAVAITRHGRIIAEIHPHRASASPKRGCLKSAKFEIATDFNESESGFEDFFADASSLCSRVAEESPVYRSSQND